MFGFLILRRNMRQSEIIIIDQEKDLFVFFPLLKRKVSLELEILEIRFVEY